MSYRGTIKNGVVILEPGAKIPEGTSVRVEPEPALIESVKRSPITYKDLDPVWKIGELAVPTGIPDLSINADYYLYGHPKVGDAS